MRGMPLPVALQRDTGLGWATEGILWANLSHLFSMGISVRGRGERLSFRNVFIVFVLFLSILFLNFLIEFF